MPSRPASPGQHRRAPPAPKLARQRLSGVVSQKAGARTGPEPRDDARAWWARARATAPPQRGTRGLVLVSRHRPAAPLVSSRGAAGGIRGPGVSGVLASHSHPTLGCPPVSRHPMTPRRDNPGRLMSRRASSLAPPSIPLTPTPWEGLSVRAPATTQRFWRSTGTPRRNPSVGSGAVPAGGYPPERSAGRGGWMPRAVPTPAGREN
jgi:hypothetical protein